MGTNWPTTSVRLVAALRSPEDHQAWERFSVDYAPALLAFCRKKGLQPADADDVVQTVFVATHLSIGQLRYRSDQGRFRCWLSTLARRAIWKLNNQRQRRGFELIDPRELNALEARQHELTEEIYASVLELAMSDIKAEYDDVTWTAFSALWFDGESAQSVAARVGRPLGWVYKAKFNVLQRLKGVVNRISHDLEHL